MCNLDQRDRERVAMAVGPVLEREDWFTGYTIAKKVPDINRHEVSSYVREAFNKGMMPGWCTTCVDTTLDVLGAPKGPLLYFRRGFDPTRTCRHLMETIRAKEAKEQGSSPGESGEESSPQSESGNG